MVLGREVVRAHERWNAEEKKTPNPDVMLVGRMGQDRRVCLSLTESPSMIGNMNVKSWRSRPVVHQKVQQWLTSEEL